MYSIDLQDGAGRNQSDLYLLLGAFRNQCSGGYCLLVFDGPCMRVQHIESHSELPRYAGECSSNYCGMGYWSVPIQYGGGSAGSPNWSLGFG
jgi:hypothetical protein